MTSGAPSVAAARDAVTAAATARWRLRVALLVAHDAVPVVSRYLIGKEVVFEAVHHVPPHMAVLPSAWTSSMRDALTALGAADAGSDGDTDETLGRLPPHPLHRGSVAVAWFARLTAHQHDGGRTSLGVHMVDVHVHPESRARRADATIDVVAERDAALGHRDRMVVARVRCATAESAAALHRELRLDFTADVDVLGPARRDEATIPLLERMALVEDYLYLAATRLGTNATDP